MIYASSKWVGKCVCALQCIFSTQINNMICKHETGNWKNCKVSMSTEQTHKKKEKEK